MAPNPQDCTTPQPAAQAPKAGSLSELRELRHAVAVQAVEGIEAPRTGRPPKLTSEASAIICGHLEHGGTIEAACRLAGVSVASVGSWQSQAATAARAVEAGADPDELPDMAQRCLSFLGAVGRARARAEAWALKELRRACTDVEDTRGNLRRGDWRAAAFVLERSNPLRWGPKAVVAHVGEAASPRRRVIIERREGARGTRTVEVSAVDAVPDPAPDHPHPTMDVNPPQAEPEARSEPPA